MTSEWPGARPLAIPELLRALNEARVEYVVIGGYALAAHRYVRGTDDLDIVPKPGHANMKRLMAAAEAIDAVPVELESGLRPDELPVPFGLRSLVDGGTWALSTRYGILHVMQAVPGAEDYEELQTNAKKVPIEGIGDVLFVAREQLIRMKEGTGRLKDRADVEELRKR